jgi:hypothetical protein
VPADALIEMVLQAGLGAADEWFAGQAGPGNIVATADGWRRLCRSGNGSRGGPAGNKLGTMLALQDPHAYNARERLADVFHWENTQFQRNPGAFPG